MSTATAAPARAGPVPEPATAGPVRAPLDAAQAATRRAPLGRVPRPAPGTSTVELGGAPAGGLAALSARWGVAGGEVLLVGQAPFVELTGSAGFRADGTLDGTVALRAAVRVLGLELAEARWTLAGWTPTTPIATPTVRLRGATLAVDLTEVEAAVELTEVEGVTATRSAGAVELTVPGDALPPGRPLDPGVVDLFRELRGWDVSGLRAHPDAPVEQAPAFVSDTELFFAPGRYGLGSPEAAALLEAAVRAALAGLVGAVAPTPPAPAAQPDPEATSAPAAPTTPVPADVAPVAPVVEGTGAATGTGAAGPGEQVESGDAGGAGAVEPGLAAGADVADAGSEAPAEVAVELLMPPAPTRPGPAARARMGAVGEGSGEAAAAARELPSGQDTVTEARGAVAEPAAETAARAQADLAAALGERPAPSPEIVELCERIRTAIREHRPVDEDDLLTTDPTREAAAAGATVAGSVESQVQEVEGGYEELDTPPLGTPSLEPTPVTTPDPTSPGMPVAARGAAPDPVPADDLSLGPDVAATDQRVAESGIDTRVTAQIPDGPFAAVREGRGELGEMAQQTPAELAAEQAAAISSAQGDMAALQQQATAALLAARRSTVGGVTEGQAGTVVDETTTREAAGVRAEQIFETARTQVSALLEPLSRTAMARWDAGLAVVSREFQDALDSVQSWIDERHSGVGGWVLGVGDAVFGLPGWVIREYDRAERAFGDGVCDLLLDISADVNAVVAAAQAVIAQSREDIAAIFTAMAEEFPEWAAQEQARFDGMLDGLAQQASDTQTGFVRDVSAAATEAVAQAQAAVEERREAARGVVGRIVAAIEAFIDDPVTAIINGLLTLVGIPPAAFWALVARIQQVVADIADDPESFVNNLVAGLRQGFEQFFDKFGTHVLGGFWTWLFSGLDVPIPMPRDLSPGSLFSFALQLMGITWPRVREILVRHVGEENVAIIEAVWELVTVLVEQGPAGLVAMVQERLSPEVVVQTILEAAVEYLVETLIQQVVVRVVAMLNPVGAVAQAIDLIYQVCSWVFRNAARIFAFVETVVNGIADVVAGNVTGLANAVERSLASLIPPVIDFLAGLLHLGGLPGEVAAVIVRLQAMVLEVLDTVIGALAERGRALLAALGLGGEEDDDQDDGEVDDELGTTVRFSADGESHRVFVQTAGTDATLMVASVPQPIQAKIDEWRGLLASGTPADPQQAADATALLAQVETVAGQADEEADRLAVLFLQAAASSEVDPPSDDALENRQRAIAGMLDRLYTLFGQQDEGRIVQDIAEHLPGHGAARAVLVFRHWAGTLARSTYLPVGATEPRPLWDPAALEPPALAAGRAVLRDPSAHLVLVPFFTSGTRRRGGAGSGEFADHALVSRSGGHPVRARFHEALGEAYAAALRSAVPDDLDPVDTAIAEQVATLAFEPGVQPYGAFRTLPGRDGAADPALVAAIAARGIVGFLRDLVLAQRSGAYTWTRFEWAWRQRPSHDHVATAFRNADAGHHEWIPTSELREVVDHAIRQAALHPQDLARSVGWVQFFHALRSGTGDVAYWIRSGPTLPTDQRRSRTPLTDLGLGAHSGAQSADEGGGYGRGMIGQGPFHDWLREVYRQERDNGPVAFGQSLISRLGYAVWDGTLDESVAPREVWFRPIDLYFSVDGGAGRIRGLTLAELAMRQRESWQRIQSDVTRALYSVDAG